MQDGQVAGGDLVSEADCVGQLLNAGLAVVQELEQSDPARMSHDAETLCGEIYNVSRQWLALASRSSRRVLFACCLHASLSIRRAPLRQLSKKVADFGGSFDRKVMAMRDHVERLVHLEASD
jgi:hypothetical protein